jgi:hypothetical protein
MYEEMSSYIQHAPDWKRCTRAMLFSRRRGLPRSRFASARSTYHLRVIKTIANYLLGFYTTACYIRRRTSHQRPSPQFGITLGITIQKLESYWGLLMQRYCIRHGISSKLPAW